MYMTEEQKQMIVRLRNVGLGYRKIAIVLELSRDKVRNYCKAIGLDGYAKKRLQAKEGKQMEEDCADSVCRYCGKSIEKQITGRRRITVRRNAEERGRRIIYRFTSMSVCFAERNLKVRPRRRSSAAMTAISGTGSGEERIQRKL